VSGAFSATVLNGGDVIPESNSWYVVANDYAMAEQFYSISAMMMKEMDPRTACCDRLIEMAALDGVYPRPATTARGYIEVTGAVGSTMPNPVVAKFGSKTYKSVGVVPDLMPTGGSTVIRVRAEEPGPEGNLLSSQAGTLNSAPTGIDGAVKAYGTFCGGADAESCEVFRQRYLRRKAFSPRATNAWIRDKILEFDCVTRVVERSGNCSDCFDCGTSCNKCQGKIEFYALFENSFECGLAPQNIINELNDWLFGNPKGIGAGQVEIGVCGTVYTAKPLKVEVHIFGLNCSTPAQQREIEGAISEIFRRASPSIPFRKRNIELAVAQIMGPSIDFEVQMLMASGEGRVSGCGDVEPLCDYMPCLESIKFSNAFTNIKGC
jgi:hypothetical protein